MRRLTKIQSDEINERIIRAKTYEEYCRLAAEYGVSLAALKLRSEKINVYWHQWETDRRKEEIRKRKIQQEEGYKELINAIRLRFPTEGASEIACDFNVSEKRVCYLASRMDIRTDIKHKFSRRECNNDPTYSVCDVNVFDDPLTPEAAYFLGLFWADGSLIEKSRGKKVYQIKINLTEPEWPILEEFKYFLKFKGDLCPSVIPSNRDGYRRKASRLLIFCNKDLYEKLIARGMFPRKITDRSSSTSRDS